MHKAAFGPPGGGVPVEAALVDALRDDRDVVPALSFVALHGEEVVGHVVCSRGRVDDSPSLGLGPLGVLPAHQRRGVGQALMHGVLAAADALEEPAVFLLGDPAYYGRFGFLPAGSLGVTSPEAGWAEHFQGRALSAWDGFPRGTFRYAAAFDRF